MELAAHIFNWLAEVHRAIRGWEWNALLMAFIGTFVGAYAAFKLERLARTEDERKHRATEGNLALVTLFEMFNMLHQYQQEVVKKAEGRDDPWLNMAVSLPTQFEELSFDPSKLHFLLEGKDKNLLAELLLTARRYRHVVDMVRDRDQLMREEILPSLSAARIARGEAIPVSRINEAVPEVLRIQAQALADGIIESVNANVQAIEGVFDKLRRQLGMQLKGEKFIRIVFDKPAGETAKTT